MGKAAVIEFECDYPTCQAEARYGSVALAQSSGWTTQEWDRQEWWFCPEHADTDPEDAQDYREELAADRIYRAGYSYACGQFD